MQRRKKPKVLTPGHALVEPYLRRLGIHPETVALFDAWDRLAGLEAKGTRAVGLKEGRLHVDVDHSARLHDLTLRKAQLLRKLQGFLGGSRAKALVSDIIFRISVDDNAR